VDIQAAAVIVSPGEGKELNLGPGRRMIKVGPHLGSKLIGVMEGLLLPSDGFAQPHVHDEYEEVFLCTRG
jgi:hypothetical protein